MKYIDAEKLKEEIESISLIPQTSADYNDGRDDMKMMFLDIINSLQQEQSKVDLEEEIEDYVEQHKSELSGYIDIRRIARHFFGLGLETQIAPNVHVIKNKFMTTEKTQAEIDDLFDRCVESENRNESAYRGMTYEQGIKATLDWLFNGAEHPLDE